MLCFQEFRLEEVVAAGECCAAVAAGAPHFGAAQASASGLLLSQICETVACAA